MLTLLYYLTVLDFVNMEFRFCYPSYFHSKIFSHWPCFNINSFYVNSASSLHTLLRLSVTCGKIWIALCSEHIEVFNSFYHHWVLRLKGGLCMVLTWIHNLQCHLQVFCLIVSVFDFLRFSHTTITCLLKALTCNTFTHQKKDSVAVKQKRKPQPSTTQRNKFINDIK